MTTRNTRPSKDVRHTLPATQPLDGQYDSDPQRHVPAPSDKGYVTGPIREAHDSELTEYNDKRNALARAERGYEFLNRLPHDVAQQFMATHRGAIEEAERKILEGEGVDPEWRESDDWDNGPRSSDDEGSY